ncbi:nucleoside-diphosphate sugar epimerase/dehydratase [Polynucleobacter sp. MG-28-Ekke-A2]|uniref:polysaccharide biosynthesis protein n=1 Tax=Polynucleobacter sp. MG-28-Ekke-A2 TaxID=3108276 RepID=UPI002B23D5A6|nr:nucleoside-diphosphate sugar epimerase/dehydratase [Polynucleobacter sp. MG-28-Ekke-A2]MEA9601189.1 nucleoside-diphosphate sugar epimerase/dehydratase [Polynucleobacter sp. MG-28-Ekke-A2]
MKNVDFDSRTQDPMNGLRNKAIALPRSIKRISVLGLDALFCVLSVYLTISLRFEEFQSLSPLVLTTMAISVGIALPIFITHGLYRAIFRYSGGIATWTIIRAVFIYGVVFFSAILSLPNLVSIYIPRSVGLSQPLLLFILIGASRAFANYWLGDAYRQLLSRKRTAFTRVLIYGAGSAGRQLAQDIRSKSNLKVVGFIDSDEHRRGVVGSQIDGIEIHSLENLRQLIIALRAEEIWLAIPSVSKSRRREIINSLLGFNVAIRTLPTIDELASGQVSISDVRQLDIDDLLNREVVPPHPLLLSSGIHGKAVLITGASGSIGSELARQALAELPATLILLERNEYGLYFLHQELLSKKLALGDAGSAINIIPILGSITDRQILLELFKTYSIDIVYHAAAYKHVPLVEQNMKEGIRNNVFGTLALVQLAAKYKVPRFILVSTDKAVRPTNIMGASKRLCEMILQAFAQAQTQKQTQTKTIFSMVRFGNVLGSSGSVVPLFRKQIMDGGPLTVTHPKVTRYFMSVTEAAQLVIQAGAMAQGGDVYLLDMGKPVKIVDLAKRMVELSGLQLKSTDKPYGDIEIIFTGLRPGEKLYEELLIGDNPKSSSHPRIFKAHDDFLPWQDLEEQLGLLHNLLDQGDIVAIRQLLHTLVSGYIPDQKIVDWSYEYSGESGGG